MATRASVSPRSRTKPSHTVDSQLEALTRSLGQVTQKPIAALSAYERNPRKHPERQIVALMASMREFGFTIPVLIDGAGTVIAGAARVEAAGRLGMTEIPVLIATDWSDAQVRAYRLADNRLAELSTWDEATLAVELASIIEVGEFEVDVMGWSTGEVDFLLDGKSDDTAADPLDDVPEPEKVPIARKGDLWLLGAHRLLCGSSLDAEAWSLLMGGDEGAMAFTDPPYNVPVSGHVSGLGKVQHAEFQMASGEMSSAEFTQFNIDYLKSMSAHLPDGAILDVCMDWRSLEQLLAAAREAGLTLINLCVWNKTNAGMGSLYRSNHELVLILKKGKAPHINNVELGRNGRYRTNSWTYAGANSFGRTRMADLADHPTVKPIALVADAIRDVSKRGQIVLDAFMGSGTTILAAERTQRIAYGIEIEPRYVDVAIRRWQAMTGSKAVLATDGTTFDETSRARGAEPIAAEPASSAE